MRCYGQTAIPAVYHRGGTSKAVFLHEKDIPPPGELRDKVLKRLMGAPDPIEIDGMGGSRIITSKIAIIKPSEREDADIDYTFVQVGIDHDDISYAGNCGNISSAVAPFSIDEGILQKPFRKGKSADKQLAAREVRIWQTGTKKFLIAHVPIDEATGQSISRGSFEIAGVPGSGAPILMDFRKTTGASQGKGLLPTDHAIDTVTVGDATMEITICDVGNICVFVSAKELGMTGRETADQINSDKAFLARAKELRGKAAQKIGMCHDWQKVDEQSPGLPMVVLVAPVLEADEGIADITLRLLLNNSCHDSMAGTGATCASACSQVPGSVVYKALRTHKLRDNVLRIQHPLGVMPFWVEATDGGKSIMDASNDSDKFEVLAFVRTARRIMDGQVYVPSEVWDGDSKM